MVRMLLQKMQTKRKLVCSEIIIFFCLINFHFIFSDKPAKPEPEPTFEILSNPARVLPQQLRVIQIDASSTRYSPVKDLHIGGIILLKDNQNQDPEELVEPVQAGGPKVEEEKEPEPPEPFDYIE